MTSQKLALVDFLADIPDFRQPCGKRYSLVSVLSLAVAAMMCGYKTYSAIAEWGHNYGKDMALSLGFKEGKTPCATTFFNILSGLDRQEVEKILGQWAESVQSSRCDEDSYQAVAIDGKSLRGSIKQGAPAAHLVSALGQRLGLTLYQVAVAEKTNEITAADQLLCGLILKDKIITADAILTQRKVCEKIIAAGADYCLPVKENQPALLAQIQGAIEGVEFHVQPPTKAETTECGHGRIEQRKMIATSALADQGIWPGLEQVYSIERRVIEQKSGKHYYEKAYGISSLSAKRARAEELMELVRGQWTIENKSHWERDVVYEEDRSQVRKGSVPQVMAALRNTAIGMMRVAGESSIAKACRRFAAQPASALALIGINITP